jgi:hypothetical protein
MSAAAGSSSAVPRKGVISFLEKRAAEFPMKVSRDLPAEVPAWPLP